MKRHVYQPPKARLTDLLAALGGLLAVVAVFVVVPLTQKMSAIFGESFTPPPEMTIEPPEDQSFEMEEPPEEPEDEPEPEEMPEDAPELDFAIDVDLTAGAGGSFVMDVPNFGLKGGEDPFGEGMDSPPTPVNRMPPQYPSALLKRGIGGKVVITCVIDAKGGMVSSKIKQSSGQSDLDKAALQAVGRWKFKPARRAGKPIQATCNIPFTFEVKKN
jgi:protein TonB